MKNVLDLYKDGVNIMKFFREEKGITENTLDSILVSYDLQSGSYSNMYNDTRIDNDLYIDNKRVSMSPKDFIKLRAKAIAHVINNLSCSSLLEVGVGEATTLCDVARNLNEKYKEIAGVDISASRIKFGQKFLQDQKVENINLMVGNMFELPFHENAFEIVFTSHVIEPNTNRAEEAIKELYRVAGRYIVLIEPTYELGNEETKRHIDEHKFCKNIKHMIDKLNYNVIEHRLFEYGVYKNQSALIIIEKPVTKEVPEKNQESNFSFDCPKCKNKLIYSDKNYFCNQCLVVYPVIKGVPILVSESAILYTKYMEV